METKMIKVPFDVDLAKKITEKSVEGRIVTREGINVRVVCWDKIDDDSPIVALLKYREKEVVETFMIDGRWHCDEGEESNLDLLLEIPEYITFKDGDVIAFGDNCIGIFKKQYGEKSHECYVMTSLYMKLIFYAKPLTYNNARFATEDEKQKLIDALKESKEPEAKECLKKLCIEEKQEFEFTFKQDVLVRQNNKDLWCGAQFSHKELNHYVVFGGSYFLQCIPYNEQTAHLLGTTENYE